MTSIKALTLPASGSLGPFDGVHLSGASHGTSPGNAGRKLCKSDASETRVLKRFSPLTACGTVTAPAMAKAITAFAIVFMMTSSVTDRFFRTAEREDRPDACGPARRAAGALD
jgi:hypothetical protein